MCRQICLIFRSMNENELQNALYKYWTVDILIATIKIFFQSGCAILTTNNRPIISEVFFHYSCWSKLFHIVLCVKVTGGKLLGSNFLAKRSKLIIISVKMLYIYPPPPAIWLISHLKVAQSP